jgi:small redox-active disulfide protein 2
MLLRQTKEKTEETKMERSEIKNVKVLGGGCRRCEELLDNTNKALSTMGISPEVEYITDMEKVMSYGIMSMPALVVNDKVASMGKVMKPSEIEKLLGKM